MIYIFDNYFRNETENIENNFLNFNLNEDVKVVISNEDFNKFERVKFDDINKDNCDCLICIENFNCDDEIVKIKCNHMFHCNCIKSWLCRESNKCPICRLEVGKGVALI